MSEGTPSSDTNRNAVLAIRVAAAQVRFVGTVAGALEDAHEIPEGKPWYRAIYADDQPVEFVMLSWNVTPEPPRIIGPWFLWKLLIDERHQRRGYGRDAVRLVADIVCGNGATELLTSCVPGDDGPEPFYRRIGFSPTGELDENGEIVLALDLGTGVSRAEQRRFRSTKSRRVRSAGCGVGIDDRTLLVPTSSARRGHAPSEERGRRPLSSRRSRRIATP